MKGVLCPKSIEDCSLPVLFKNRQFSDAGNAKAANLTADLNVISIDPARNVFQLCALLLPHGKHSNNCFSEIPRNYLYNFSLIAIVPGLSKYQLRQIRLMDLAI